MTTLFNPQASLSFLLEKRRAAQAIDANPAYVQALAAVQTQVQNQFMEFYEASVGVMNSQGFFETLREAVNQGMHAPFIQAFRDHLKGMVEGFPDQFPANSVEHAAIQARLMGKNAFGPALESLSVRALSAALRDLEGSRYPRSQMPDLDQRVRAFIEKACNGLVRSLREKESHILESFEKAQDLGGLAAGASLGSLVKAQVAYLHDEGGLANKRTIASSQQSELLRSNLCLAIVSQEGLKLPSPNISTPSP